MEKKRNRFLIWIYLIPVYALVAWPITKWVKKTNSGEMRLSRDEYEMLNSQDGELRRGDYLGENPDLYDSALDVRYRTKGERAADLKAETARRAAEKAAEAARPAERRAPRLPEDRVAMDQKMRELEFIRKHGKAIQRYQGYLASLGKKYRNKYPALARMDAEFGRMDRYMALRRQYEADRNAYKWARGVMSLPEVRSALIRYSTNAEVLKGVIEVSMEALRNPPPKPIFDEVAGFFREDQQASAYLNDVSMQAMTNVMAIAPTVAQTSDLATLQNLGMQIAGGGPPPATGR